MVFWHSFLQMRSSDAGLGVVSLASLILSIDPDMLMRERKLSYSVRPKALSYHGHQAMMEWSRGGFASTARSWFSLAMKSDKGWHARSKMTTLALAAWAMSSKLTMEALQPNASLSVQRSSAVIQLLGPGATVLWAERESWQTHSGGGVRAGRCNSGPRSQMCYGSS